MVTQERKLVTILEAERIIKESRNKREMVKKLHSLPKRGNNKNPPPEGGITIQAAHRKYNMHSSTLARWASKGIIPILLRTKNETYLDELALASLVRKYKQNPGQGKQTIRQIIGSK